MRHEFCTMAVAPGAVIVVSHKRVEIADFEAAQKNLFRTSGDIVDALAEELTKENIEILEGMIGRFKADLALVKAGLFPAEAEVS